MIQSVLPLHCSTRQLLAALPDEELIARISCQDEPALETLYTRYRRLIFSIGLRITGDHAVTEEIVQDTFQAVWQSARDFQSNRNFTTWLASIARHRAIDATRARSFSSRNHEELLQDDELTAPISDVDMLVLRIELQRALALLPASQRSTIVLAFFGGLTHVEIAAYMHAPIGTVKSRMRVGIARLREAFDEMVV